MHRDWSATSTTCSFPAPGSAPSKPFHRSDNCIQRCTCSLPLLRKRTDGLAMPSGVVGNPCKGKLQLLHAVPDLIDKHLHGLLHLQALGESMAVGHELLSALGDCL